MQLKMIDRSTGIKKEYNRWTTKEHDEEWVTYEWLCPKCNNWQDTHHHDKWNGSKWIYHCGDCGYEWDDSNCFITTATLISIKGVDDCYELQKFREFRDKWLKTNFPDEIKEYYTYAPIIVNSIDKQHNSNEIYLEIWNKHLSTCLSYIENHENQKTFENYKLMFNELKRKYLEIKP